MCSSDFVVTVPVLRQVPFHRGGESLLHRKQCLRAPASPASAVALPGQGHSCGPTRPLLCSTTAWAEVLRKFTSYPYLDLGSLPKLPPLHLPSTTQLFLPSTIPGFRVGAPTDGRPPKRKRRAQLRTMRAADPLEPKPLSTDSDD